MSDDVNGTIIGGDWVDWKLFYEGRQQGPRHIAPDDETAMNDAIDLLNTWRTEDWFYDVYPRRDKEAWEVRRW